MMNQIEIDLKDYAGKTPDRDATTVFLYGVTFHSPQEFESLRSYTKMKRLNLASSKVNDECLAVMTGLPNVQALESLDLDATAITDQGLKTLLRIKTLQVLRLKEVATISDQGMIYLRLLKHLRELHLGGTPITITGVKELATLPHLTDLILDEDLIVKSPDPALSKAEFEKVSKLMPMCQILFKGYGALKNGQWV